MKTINNIIFIISLYIAFIVLVSPKPSGYELIFLHPLIFAIGFICNDALKSAKFSRPSLLVIFSTMFVRYDISPLLLSMSGYPVEIPVESTIIMKSMLLMCYEEILVFYVVHRFGRKFLLQTKEEIVTSYSPFRASPIIYMFILLGLLFILFLPEVQSRYHFLFSLSGNEYESYNKNTGVIFSVIFEISKLLLSLLLISHFAKKYKYCRQNKYVYASVGIIGLNLLVVHDISRFGILLPVMVLSYLILQLFPTQKKKVLMIVFLFSVLAVGFATFIKMFSETRGGTENSDDIVSWAVTVQQYFMGQRDVCIGISVADRIPPMGLVYFLNDAFYQIIFLHKFTYRELYTFVLYNYEYNQGLWVDKIFPNICAGYTYFGQLLSPLITVIFIWLSLKFDIQAFYTKKIEYKFILVYAAIMCSFVMMQCYADILGVLVGTIFLMYIILRLNSFILK